jgi:alpha-tubulin suppressor-like RCC1 family protein
MARQWTSVLRCLIWSAGVGVIVASFGVTTRASLVGGSAIQQSPRPIDVVAGLSFGCALSSDGSVHCWGANDKGQLGIGTMDSASHGVTRLPGDYRFRSLRAGFSHVCGVTEQGDAFCWGAGDWAQLGNGRFGHSAVPTLVTGGLKFRAVMPGGTITCGIAIGGELYCWGGNNHGQAGVGDKNGDPDTSCCYKRPRRVAADRLFKAVMAGGIHGCAVDVDGKGYCWGYQHDGRLGNGEPGTARNVPDLPAPVPISTDATLTAMAERSWHTCAFATNGDLLCWGLGEHGRLGNGSADSRPVPTRVVTPTPFKTVSVGSRHSCAG